MKRITVVFVEIIGIEHLIYFFGKYKDNINKNKKIVIFVY